MTSIDNSPRTKCCKKSRTFYMHIHIFLFCQTFLFSYTWHLATNHDFADFESFHPIQSVPHYDICLRTLFSGLDDMIPTHGIWQLSTINLKEKVRISSSLVCFRLWYMSWSACHWALMNDSIPFTFILKPCSAKGWTKNLFN